VRAPVCFGQASTRRFSAQKSDSLVSESAPTETKKDGVRERAWGGPVSPNFGVLARGNDELRRAISQ
jgi:hypothetical protein